jgi:hypothetical protein
MYALIVTRSYFNFFLISIITGGDRLASRDAGSVRAKMNASAQDPVDPGSTRDSPTEGAPAENTVGKHPSFERAPSNENPPPKAGQQPKPNPFLTSPNVEGAPANARVEATEQSWPPWERPQPAFPGDTMADVRRATHTDDAQTRPMSGPMFAAIVVATSAAAGAVAYLWSSHQGSNPPDRVDLLPAAVQPSVPPSPGRQPASGTHAVAELPALPPDSDRRPLVSQSDEARLRESARQLTIKAARLWQVDAPARLIVSAADAPADVDVLISGLATGTVLSLGKPTGPNGWRLSAKDLNSVMILPPRGFVGVMDLILELRLANDSMVDRKGLLLEWSHNSAVATAAFPPRQLEAAEIELMVKSGLDLMGNGNIAAARMMFRPAAESGDAVAAFALAETYDPSVLKQLGAIGGITPDVALANTWYEKARALGSPLARERLERLARARE